MYFALLYLSEHPCTGDPSCEPPCSFAHPYRATNITPTTPSRATAEKLASLGARMALCDIRHDALEIIYDEEGLGGTYGFDVGSSAQCDAAVADILEDLGPIDFVFNCAGVNPTALAITDTTDQYFDTLVNTNLRGTFNITRAAVPHLRSGAAIVNVASVAGLRATKGYSVVSAAALPSWTVPWSEIMESLSETSRLFADGSENAVLRHQVRNHRLH